MSLYCHSCSVPVKNPYITINDLEAIFFFWPEYQGKNIHEGRRSICYHHEHSIGRIPADEIKTFDEILDVLRAGGDEQYKKMAKKRKGLCTSVRVPFYSIREDVSRASPPALQILAEHGIRFRSRNIYLSSEVEETISICAPLISRKMLGYVSEETARTHLPEFFEDFQLSAKGNPSSNIGKGIIYFLVNK